MNLRKVMYVVIIIVCIWSIGIGVYEQVNNKITSKSSDKNIVLKNNNSENSNTQTAQTQDELKKDFDKIFTNQINIGSYNTDNIEKTNSQKEILYTAYSSQEKKENYELNINVPVVNIKGEVANNFNKLTQTVFVDKANDIMKNATQQTVYSISYAGYINNDILSVIVKSTLKEGSNAQRVMIQTYNLNLLTNKEASINNLIDIRNIDKDTVEKAINTNVSEAIKEASSIQETGYDVYKRDLTSDIYKIDNVDTYFLDSEGYLCIVFAYGNSELTSEMDLIKI